MSYCPVSCGSRTATATREADVRIRSAEVLREYLGLLGLSERALARSAGISHSTLNHLLTGRRVTCSVRTATAIERALGCASGVFFQNS
jgi:plasmid maintenance system antidote protein VapI